MAEPAIRGPKRASVGPLLLLVAAALASLVFLVHPWYEATRETADASIYLLCAKSLLAGDGYSVLGQPFTVRPPGFSVLLLPVLAWRGLDFLALNAYVSLFGVAAVACLFALFRERIGALAGLALAAVAWLNPAFRHLSNEILSDLPGLFALLLCLLVERRASRSPSVRGDLLFGIVAGLSTYVRTLAGLVVPAAILVRAAQAASRRELAPFLRSRALPIAVAFAAVAVPWTVRNALHHPPWPSEQTQFATYGSTMWHADPGDPSSPIVPIREILARPSQRAPEILAALGGRLAAGSAGGLAIAIGALLAASLAIVGWIRRGVPELAAIATLAVLLFFPMPLEARHLLPVWVLAMAAAADAVVLALDRILAPAPARAAAAASLLALAAADFEPRSGWSEIAASYAADRALADDVARRLAPRDRVAAPIGWHWSLFLDRPVYNLHIQSRRMGTAGIDQVIRDRAIDAVIVRTDPPEAPNTLAFLEAEHGPGETVGPVRIVRIRK